MPDSIADPGLAKRARMEIAGGVAVVAVILGVAFYKWERPADQIDSATPGFIAESQNAAKDAATPPNAKAPLKKGVIVHPSTLRPPQKPRTVTIPGLIKPLNLAPPPLIEYERPTARRPLTKAEILDRRRIRASRLARFSREHTDRRDAVTGALLALEAIPDAKIAAGETTSAPTANPAGTTYRNGAYLDVYRALYAAYLHRREFGVLNGHFRYVRNAIFSHDGARLATVSSDRRARLWDPRTGADIALLKGHDGEVWDAAFSPDDRFLATASFDGVIRIWSTDSGGERAVLKGHGGEVAALAYSPDGRFLVSGSYDGTARIWDTQTFATHAILTGHTDKLRSVGFSPDGASIATVGDDANLHLWDTATGRERLVMRGHSQSIRRVAFSPDGRMLATASADGVARLWNTSDGSSIAVLRGHESWVDFIAFSPDGDSVATASRDKTARLWRTSDGAPLHVLRGHESWVNTVAFSPDGAMLLTGSSDWTARLWRTGDGSSFATLAGHRGELWAAAFGPDGRVAATASADGMARLWAVDPAAQNAQNAPHNGLWTKTTNGRLSVSVYPDGAARIVDASSGADIATLPGPAKHAAFSPDGDYIVVIAPDDTARLYQAFNTLDDLASAIKPVLPRTLTRTERLKFIILPNAGD